MKKNNKHYPNKLAQVSIHGYMNTFQIIIKPKYLAHLYFKKIKTNFNTVKAMVEGRECTHVF